MHRNGITVQQATAYISNLDLTAGKGIESKPGPSCQPTDKMKNNYVSHVNGIVPGGSSPNAALSCLLAAIIKSVELFLLSLACLLK